MIFPLNVGDIPQRQRHGIADTVADTDTVEGGGKLRRIGGADEQKHDGNGAGVLEHHIQMIKQLLRRDGIAADALQQHRAGAIDLHAVLGAEQIDQQIVEHQKDQCGAQHEGNILHPDLGHLEQHQCAHRQHRQKGGVEAAHGAKAPQNQTEQLGSAGELMNGRGTVDVVEQVGHRARTS